jgi:Arc/MetJ family transcription regulator
MANRRLHITLDDDLAAYIDRKVQVEAGYETAEAYVGELIRQDMEADDATAEFVCDLLADAVNDGEDSFRAVEPSDVIRRNSVG